MSEIGHCAGGIRFISVALRPLTFEREDSHVANLQADADLHTLSSHHRDAVHRLRRANAARIDRAARPQLQFADLSLRALRFRREFFKDAVSKRDVQWTRSFARKRWRKNVRPKF